MHRIQPNRAHDVQVMSSLCSRVIVSPRAERAFEVALRSPLDDCPGNPRRFGAGGSPAREVGNKAQLPRLFLQKRVMGNA